MDPFEVCLIVMVAAAATLAWAEWRKMKREDSLHELRMERERLKCLKLAREVEEATAKP